MSGEDAVAYAAPTRRKPQLRRTRINISKKRAAKRAPSEAPAYRGRTMPGRYGSADRRGAFLAISLETGFTPVLETERQGAGQSAVDLLDELVSGEKFCLQGAGH